MSKLIIQGPEPGYTIDSSLGEFYFSCGERFADNIFQTDVGLDVGETYSSMKLRTTRAALEMTKRGIVKGDIIALCNGLTLDSIIPIIAATYIGAIPTNLEPALSVLSNTYLLSLVCPKMIFVDDFTLSAMEECLKNANLTPQVVVFGSSDKYGSFQDFVAPQPGEEDFRPVQVSPQDLAIIYFSSGTTGAPKAISHSNYSFLFLSHSFAQGGCLLDSFMIMSSYYWISSLLTRTASCVCGGCRYICDFSNIELIFQSIEKYKIRIIGGAPVSTFRLTNFGKKQHYDVSSVYNIILGGSALSFNHNQKLRALFHNALVVLVYGCSEAGVVSLFNPKTDVELIESKVGCSGKLLPGVQIKIADLDSRGLLGPNERGEICIKSPGLMMGHYRSHCSDFDQDGFVMIGDLGYYDEDECVYIVERIKEMFKYKMWHIIPTVVEAILLEHPAIEEAVVIGIPIDEEYGEMPAACVVVRSNCKASKEEIEEFVASKVSDHERLRGGVFFMNRLLRTCTGKVMRKEIRKSVLESLG